MTFWGWNKLLLLFRQTRSQRRLIFNLLWPISQTIALQKENFKANLFGAFNRIKKKKHLIVVTWQPLRSNTLHIFDDCLWKHTLTLQRISSQYKQNGKIPVYRYMTNLFTVVFVKNCIFGVPFFSPPQPLGPVAPVYLFSVFPSFILTWRQVFGMRGTQARVSVYSLLRMNTQVFHTFQRCDTMSNGDNIGFRPDAPSLFVSILLLDLFLLCFSWAFDSSLEYS